VPALTADVAALEPVNVGVLLLPAGVPALTASLATAVPVKAGAEFEPAAGIVKAPPVSSTVSKAELVGSRAIKTRPVPKATHVPKPRVVAGFIGETEI
jgi:hypothetical protein